MVQQPATFACCATLAIVPCCSRPTPPLPAYRAVRPAQAAMRALQPGQAGALSAFAAELTDLRKYAVLNYVACIKAVKKRNRHLRAAVGPGAAGPPLRAVDLLSQQYFFTSPKLAALATRAEVLLQARAPHAAPRDTCRQAWSDLVGRVSRRPPCTQVLSMRLWCLARASCGSLCWYAIRRGIVVLRVQEAHRQHACSSAAGPLPRQVRRSAEAGGGRCCRARPRRRRRPRATHWRRSTAAPSA